MYQTNYHRPSSLAEAASLFSGADDAAYLSGGHTLIPTMKQRLAAPSDLIDISGPVSYTHLTLPTTPYV